MQAVCEINLPKLTSDQHESKTVGTKTYTCIMSCRPSNRIVLCVWGVSYRIENSRGMCSDFSLAYIFSLLWSQCLFIIILWIKKNKELGYYELKFCFSVILLYKLPWRCDGIYMIIRVGILHIGYKYVFIQLKMIVLFVFLC